METPTALRQEKSNIAVHTLAEMFLLSVETLKKNMPDIEFFDIIEALGIAATDILYRSAVPTNIFTDEQFGSIAEQICPHIARTFEGLELSPSMEILGLVTFLARSARKHKEQLRARMDELGLVETAELS